MRSHPWSGVAALALVGCSGASTPPEAPIDAATPAFVPGEARLLSVDSPGDDEDPAVLRARDGSLYVAWFSHAAGDDLVITRTTDGVTWTPPAYITRGAPVDFGPALYQAGDGTLHAVWFRWPAGAPPGKIVHARALAPDDGLRWDAAAEVDVTHASGTDDWVPAIAGAADGALVVAMARNTCPPPATCYGIAVTRSLDDGASWSPPVTVVPAGAGVEHHLPALARDGAGLALAWTPYDAGAGAPWDGLSTGAHVAVARSPDGVTWGAPADVTARAAGAVSLFPTMFVDHGGRTRLAWMTADAGGQAVVARALDGDGPPVPLPITGYSPRVVATPTAGVDLAAWVDGPPGERDIVVRLFAVD